MSLNVLLHYIDPIIFGAENKGMYATLKALAVFFIFVWEIRPIRRDPSDKYVAVNAVRPEFGLVASVQTFANAYFYGIVHSPYCHVVTEFNFDVCRFFKQLPLVIVHVDQFAVIDCRGEKMEMTKSVGVIGPVKNEQRTITYRQ